jgi:O-antigen ligase
MNYFLGIILALLPTYLLRFEIFGVPTTFLEILILTFLFVTLITKFKNIPNLKKLERLNWLVLAFVISGVVSVLVSPETIKALGLFKAFIFEPVLIFYAVNLIIVKKSDLRIPMLFLFWSAVIISIWGIIQYITLLGLPIRFWGTGEEVRRIASVFEFPNALALYLGPLIAFFTALCLDKYDLVSRKTFTWGIGLMLLALFLTFSRGAWVAVFFTLLFLTLKYYPWKKVLLGLAIILFILTLVPQIANRLTISDPSSMTHLNLVQVGINKIIADPVFGNGLFGFRDTLVQANYPAEILNYPHNIFLNFWLELGLLGFLSFFSIIWYVLDRHKKNPSVLGFAVIAFMAVILIHGLVDVPYFKNDLAILFWFMIALNTIKN